MVAAYSGKVLSFTSEPLSKRAQVSESCCGSLLLSVHRIDDSIDGPGLSLVGGHLRPQCTDGQQREQNQGVAERVGGAEEEGVGHVELQPLEPLSP